MPVSFINSSRDCSDAEWQARVELAALFRIVDHYGMSDLVNGAVCARVPDQPDHYLVHPYGMFWEEARASSMIKIDASGNPVDPNAPWLNDGVQNLCQWILGSRPETNFFVHGHEEEVMAVSSIKDGILPLNQPAVYLGNLTGYIEYEFEEDEAFGRHFVEQLGKNQNSDQPQSWILRLGRNSRSCLLPRLFPATDLFHTDQDPLDGPRTTPDRSPEGGAIPGSDGRI